MPAAVRLRDEAVGAVQVMVRSTAGSVPDRKPAAVVHAPVPVAMVRELSKPVPLMVMEPPAKVVASTPVTAGTTAGEGQDHGCDTFLTASAYACRRQCRVTKAGCNTMAGEKNLTIVHSPGGLQGAGICSHCGTRCQCGADLDGQSTTCPECGRCGSIASRSCAGDGLRGRSVGISGRCCDGTHVIATSNSDTGTRSEPCASHSDGPTGHAQTSVAAHNGHSTDSWSVVGDGLGASAGSVCVGHPIHLNHNG